ncbi:MAG: hypothetical protein C4567_12965 [Deltaproteobacteria bacterium]|nr:MAG: hypothetical protein C4567_12965 [Deltaproteobacteria bacterium]
MIALGIPGLVLPFLQGVLFIALGALILSVDIPVFEHLVQRLEERVPRIKKPLERLRNFLRGANNGSRNKGENLP